LIASKGEEIAPVSFCLSKCLQFSFTSSPF